MNKAPASRTRRRSYDNTLREEQAQLTRRRILDAAVGLLGDSTAPGQPTMGEVARRAGVSEPTIYRHFGSRERLYEELDAHAQAHLGLPSLPKTMAEMPSQVRELYRKFGEHTELIRAVTTSGIGKEMRERGRARRAASLREVIAKEAPHLEGRELQAVSGVLRTLIGWETFQLLIDHQGLSSDEAGDVVAWAVRALTERLEQDREAGRRVLGSHDDEGGTR